ncbi:MAG: PEGA domain-containing protein [bacterium]|nr:PEGA domain-containing protein [bacterium]
MRTVLWILLAVVLLMAGYLVVERWWPKGEGTLVVMSDPPGAQVWLDLKPTTALTNSAALRIAAGPHSVTVRKDTMEADPFAIAVDIRPGDRDTVRFSLIPPSLRLPQRPAVLPRTVVPPPAEPPQVLDPERLELLWEARRDSLLRADTSRVAPPVAKPRLPSIAPLEISSTLLGARVYINDSLRPEVTPVTLRLPPGNYTVRVALEGYVPDPRDQTVRLVPSTVPQFVFFTLAEDRAAHREIVIETTPVSGPILVDNAPVGEGKAVVPRDFGIYTVSFGEVEGFRTPQPVQVSLTPLHPRPEVKGAYTRVFHVSAQAESENGVKTDGGLRWETGVYFNNTAQPNASLGPRIREVSGTRKFGWELAAGDPNRNPVGGDYIEFIFELPPDVPPDSPLGLRLYLYRSGRRYALTVSSRSELVVTVNGRKFLAGYRPTHAVTAADYDRYEEWSLQGMLQPGENRVMIRTSDDNTLYNYLWKFEIR